MEKLSAQLPPLEPLVAFEAAARLLSFTLAASELNLSQAAVSQRIRNLENYLGISLFKRTHKAVQLSSAGKEFQHTVSAALRQLASATADLKAPATRQRLTVAVDQSVASMWLMPRLPDFQQSNPDIAIRLIASDDEQDCLASDVQLAIIHGDGVWPGFESEQLFEEEVFAVCAPTFLEESGNSSAGLENSSQLIDLTLLELEDDRWDWMNWRVWLSATGSDLPTNHNGYRINSYPLVVEAAKNGQGIALGWRYLVDDDLANGALIKPLPHSVRTRFGYYLVWPSHKSLVSAGVLFRQWAIDQLIQQRAG